MCGIVGYLGHRQATEVLVEGLSKLEYRGYDSAGVAVNTGNELEIRKFKGRLAILAEDLEKSPIVGGLGIGHTRWATHGEPSDVNSHPHFNMDRTIAVVHNDHSQINTSYYLTFFSSHPSGCESALCF